MDDDLRALLEENLAPLGEIRIRRMFGGAGVFLDGLMFGLIADGVLYLKADDANRLMFEAEGLAPFAYERTGGRTVIMSYWRTPERLLDEPDEMLAWAREALAAARRGHKSAPASGGRKKRSHRSR